jgi:hypothetical protein
MRRRTPTILGLVVHVVPALQRRVRVLAAQLEHDIASALRELGALASHAYLSHAGRGGKPTAQLPDQVLDTIRVDQWVRRRETPILQNHAVRVIADTQRTLRTEIGLDMRVPVDDARRIVTESTKDLRLPDIEPQVRAAIRTAIEEGYAAGENPVATARRIREYVPAGRFVHAGAAYRSRLIARTETLDLQREATLAAYQANESVTHIQIRDGLLADSDDACKARNGRIVPKADAASIQPLHPQCTLSFSPVVSPSARVREPEPAFA